MPTKVKSLLYLIFSGVLMLGAVIMMIVATVQSSKLGKMDYSHSIEIVSVEAEEQITNSVLYYVVSIDGEIVNNTNKDYSLVTVKVVFDGINNKTGQDANFESIFVIDEFNSKTKYSVADERFRVGNASGFIPESIEEIEISIDGESRIVKFEEVDDSNLIVFAGALVSLFISILLFAKWNNLNKKSKTVQNGNKNNL